MASLSETQRAFLTLHTDQFVEMWRWVLGGSYLRACAAGRCVTIAAGELAELVDAGRLAWSGSGCLMVSQL